MRAIAPLLLAVSLCPMGCSGGVPSSDHRAWSTADSWYHPPASMESRANATAVAWAEVKPSAVAAAERELGEREFVPVDATDAIRFLEQPLVSSEPSPQLFLVRGVYLGRYTGGSTVTWNGHDLFVDHGCLGRSAVPMSRQPLIVALPSAPSRVYVSAWMAE